MFKKIDLFVYSGTGNTYKAAQCIGEASKSKGTDYEIRMIDSTSRPEEYKPASDRLMGLMAPTIGSIQPMSFFGFILRLPKVNGQKVFLVGTGAWGKAGSVFIPGYVGYGLYLAALFLLLKGYSVVGITGFGMPHNWTTLIPPYSKNLENRINNEIHSTASKFTFDMLSEKKVYNRIGDLIFTLLVFPLTLLFIFIGHPFLTKTIFAGSSCNGCGLCAKNCPKKAIRMYGGKSKRPYWSYKCELCMRCAGYCPNKAVDANTFLLVACTLIFFVIPVNTLVVGFLNSLFDFASVPGHILLGYLVDYIVILLLAAAVYSVLFLLNRVPLLNKAFTYLSFTHYWRKYRQAGVKIDSLTGRQEEG